VLPETIDRFKNSGRQFNAGDIVDAYLDVRQRLTEAWQVSLSDDGEGREALYRQLKGLDSVMDQLISGW
jgi:hypothetical protein